VIPLLEDILLRVIESIREDGVQETREIIGRGRTLTGEPPLVIGLARFQSYRARTQAALVQELVDYIDDAQLNVVHFKVLDDSQVLVW